MEEDEFRSTYKSINETRCIYEKALNSRRVHCSHMQRFFLADREGVGCQTEAAAARCRAFLNRARENARFALQLTHIAGPLPHNKEIKVQIGGLLGLQALVDPMHAEADEVANAFATLNRAEERFGSPENYPWPDILPAIARTRGRERRNRRGDDS